VKTELELRHLRVFVAVVEAGGHTRAARSLGLSQSTVSETLSALDRTLGTALFRRSTKGLALTPSGEALLPYARRILALTREVVTELAKVSTRVSATLVVSAVESLCAYVLPPHLAALRLRWPNVRMEVTSGSCVDVRQSVAAGKSDVGLVLEAETGEEDGSILARLRLMIVGSPHHAFARATASPEELRGCEFLMSDAAGSYHQLLRHYFDAAELPPPATEALGTVEGVKRGVLARRGAVGLLPVHAVDEELRDGTLAEIRIASEFPGLVMRAVSAGSGGSPVVEDLLESLRGAVLGGSDTAKHSTVS
jgi:DNA-binding transcriptional LysR family regulator